MGLFDRIKKGFSKTRDALSEKVRVVFKPGRKIDDDLLDELEEALLAGDVDHPADEIHALALRRVPFAARRFQRSLLPPSPRPHSTSGLIASSRARPCANAAP